jgi:hypothetical protein
MTLFMNYAACNLSAEITHYYAMICEELGTEARITTPPKLGYDSTFAQEFCAEHA